MHFKAVIFDMGGVIKSYPEKSYFDKIIEYTKNNPKLCKIWWDLEKGIAAPSDVQAVVKGITTAFPDLAKTATEMFGGKSPLDYMPDDPYFATALSKIRDAGFRTALLTNNFYLDVDKTKTVIIPNAHELFDIVIESCKVGYRKPELEIYQLVAERLGVKLEECIMIDDMLGNCEGAVRAGMAAIQVKKGASKTAIEELEKLLEMKLL